MGRGRVDFEQRHGSLCSAAVCGVGQVRVQAGSGEQARAHAEKLADAVRGAWKGKFLNRGWLDSKTEIGATDMFLEPQPWALIAGILDEKSAGNPGGGNQDVTGRPIGKQDSRCERGGEETPSHAFNGIWASINSTLVWGLSKVSPEQARREHLANTLFNHARTYPKNWFGIWSGPDVYFNSDSKRPGETYTFNAAFAMQGWPVQILFQHSEPLNSSLWMLGIEANAEGIEVRPRVPLEEWSWSGSGLSLKYAKSRIHGAISGVGSELLRVVICNCRPIGREARWRLTKAARREISSGRARMQR